MNIFKLKRKIKKIAWGKILVYIVLLMLVTFTSLPLVAMICRAFMPLEELFIYPPRIFVRNPTLENFSDLFISLDSSDVPFTRYIYNSLITTVITVVLTIVVSSMGAFSLVKYKPDGSKAIFTFVLAALMFSSHVTQIPNYMVVNKLGLIDSYWSLIIPKIAVAYNFFLMKQFCEQIPNELLESARIDGASEIRLFWQIAMPLLKPAWSTLAVFAFVNNWNDYFSPLIYISDQAKKTLPLALQTLSGGPGVVARAGTVAAATLATTAPTVIVFTIMKGRVMKTMAHSGIKA